MQTLRFTLQRHLKVTTLSTAGANLRASSIPRRWSRFVIVAVLRRRATAQALPTPGSALLGLFSSPAPLAQVLGHIVASSRPLVGAVCGISPWAVTLMKSEVDL